MRREPTNQRGNILRQLLETKTKLQLIFGILCGMMYNDRYLGNADTAYGYVECGTIMIKGDRLAKIKEILYNVNSVKVDELASLMNVSLVTIRHDLSELEKEGFATRIHGGAIINEDKKVSMPNFYLSKDLEDVVSKNIIIPLNAERKIGMIARDLIKENSWIFLGCGSTCASIAHMLVDRQVNVVTNSVLVATILSQNPRAMVLVTGGYLSGSYRSYMAGDIFEQALANIRVDIAFFGTAAINFERGFSVQGVEEKSIYCSVRKIARRMAIVASTYKYGKDSYFTLANLDEPDLIIAEADPPEEYKRYFEEHQISLATRTEEMRLSEYEQTGDAP